MNIVKKNINDLKPSPYNPRKNIKENKKFYKKLKNSIVKFGYVEPLVYNKKSGFLIGGHQRMQVLKDLGYTEIDVIELDVDDKHEKSLNIALNKITGDWDTDKLKNLLDELHMDDEIFEYTGFDEEEIALLESEIDGTKEDNFEIPHEPKYKINIGDIFQLGNHKLMCGDSTNINDLKKLVENKKIHLLITDPPYNVNYSSKKELLNLYDKGNKIQTPLVNVFQSEKEYQDFTVSWFTNCLNFLSDYNSVYIFGNYESLITLYQLQDFIISNMLVWVKNNIILGRMDYKGQHEFILYGWKKHHKWFGGNGESTVLKCDKPLSNDLHPTMKPLELLYILIKNSSLSGSNVLDVFGGSGSTLISCEQTKRNCFMMEIDPFYCSVIIERWENFTGMNHIKISNNSNNIINNKIFSSCKFVY